MRIRLHMVSGDAVDAEQFSPDDGTTWVDIQVAHVKAAMTATTGYTVVRDVLTGQWRSFRNAQIESIGPAGDISQVIAAEVERRIQALLAKQLPQRVRATTEPSPPGGTPDPEPPAGDLRGLASQPVPDVVPGRGRS